MRPVHNGTVFLLVEDDPNDAFLVEREFKSERRPISLHAVEDGQDAVHYLRGDGKFANRKIYPIPNVILLDLKMPRLSGFDFLRWLRNDSPENVRYIPVVVLSSSYLQCDVQQAYALGANSYMVKPLKWEAFRNLLMNLGIYWTQHALTPHFSK